MSDKHVRDNPTTEKAKRTRLRAQRARPTLGLLLEHVAGPGGYQAAVWTGATEASREQDANLICLAGGTLRFSPFDEFMQQRNSIYELATRENVDGLIISSTVGSYTDQEEFQRFCDRYRSLPRVSIGMVMPGIPSVLVDNTQGMREAIAHLIETHGYRRIAFIRGPEGNEEAEQRYQVYTEVLAEHKLPLDPDLVTPGDFAPPAGTAAVRLLLDERKVSLQAIVAANDMMALAALEALQARGIRVPSDVAVVGFDDIEEAMTVTPSLTTVRQPTHKLGQRAVEVLLALLANKRVPEQTTLPTELVVRQSCGCSILEVVQAAVEPVASAGEPFEVALAAQRETILSEVAHAVQAPPDHTVYEGTERLLNAFLAELKDESPGAFLSALEAILHQVAATGGEVVSWQKALSVLRRCTLPYLGNKPVLSRAENLWQQSRVLIGEMALRARAHRQWQAEQRAEALRGISQSIITTSELAGLVDVMARELPQLGISSAHLSLYEGKDRPPKWSRLILAYDEKGRVELEAGGRRFLSRRLAPDGLLPRDRQYNIVVEPLYSREQQYGLALFEVGPQDGVVYEALRGQLSNALKGILLLQERKEAEAERERLLADLERRALQLQTAAQVSQAVGSILNMDELLSQVVELIRARFNLYYTGLFLVDRTGERTGEPDKWAVLWAGTGQAGLQMMERGHKLEIGGASMIGWCIANKRARIALDVGEDAVRFGNPLLPETRSEMALPFISQGRVIGAVTIQSAQPAAFTQEDITILQTMADQLANAVENARLFTERARAEEALTRERYLMSAFMDNIPSHIYFKDTKSCFIRISKSQADRFGLSHSDQAVGKTDFDFFTEAHARPAYEAEQEIIRTGQPLEDLEERETWADRPDTWVSTTKMPLRDETGNIIGTFGISTDITERKRAEEALAYEQYLLNSLMDNAPYRIYFKDAEGCFIRVNQAWAEQHDLDDPAQAIGKTDFDFVAEKNARSALADEQRIIKTGQPLMDKEATRTLSDGRQVWSSISKQPLYDKDGQIIGTFGISRDITEHKRLMADLERRALQLQTAAEVSRAASSILNVDELLPQVVELIRARFNLYYTGLFLVDETGQWAVLRAGTGEPGRKMLEAGHKLPLGGTSMLSSCVAQGKASVALDMEKAVQYKNPYLPETRSEMALPLISRGRAIGAMTIQSAQPAAFSQDDITTLQTMADQLANAIENAVLFDESKRARLLLDKRVTGLDCLNDIGRKLEETVSMPKFLQWVTERIPPIMQYPDPCVVAIEYRGQVYGVPEALALPRQMVQGLRIDGELVGRLCIAYTEEHDFLDEESALLGDIARRVNGYLENQQLLSETQARARREQTLREITARVRSSMDPDTVMRTAIRELGTALGRPAFVRLGSAEQLSKAQSAGDDGENLTQEGGE
jgi:PAS domain S-box-containing protein